MSCSVPTTLRLQCQHCCQTVYFWKRPWFSSTPLVVKSVQNRSQSNGKRQADDFRCILGQLHAGWNHSSTTREKELYQQTLLPPTPTLPCCVTMALWSQVHPVTTTSHPQLMEMKQDWGVYLGLPFFTMSSITWCCWRRRGFMLFALKQDQRSTGPAEGRPEVEGVLLPAQSWCPALRQMGHQTTPYHPCITGCRTGGTFLPPGIWAPCCSNPCRNGRCCYEKTVVGGMLS